MEVDDNQAVVMVNITQEPGNSLGTQESASQGAYVTQPTEDAPTSSVNHWINHEVQINLADSRISNIAVSPTLEEMKTSLTYDMKMCQKQIQELKNTQRVDHQICENVTKDVALLKGGVTKAENKLGPLQKMIASITDRTLSMKKDMKEMENNLKAQVTEVQKVASDNKKEILEIKGKLTQLEQRTNSFSMGRPLPNSTAANLPEDMMQLLEQYDRQLGMYDVRLAEMDSRFQVLENTSYSGTLVWKIPDYARRKLDAVSGRTLSLYSQPFYTSRYGYKMCARIYLNGDGMGRGTHISLFFVVMKGEFDALLPWPFRQKVTMMMLDQGIDRRHLTDTFRPDPTSSSFKRPTTDMNIASGCPLFVAHTVIDGSTYIANDTVFVRIMVDTSDLDGF